MKLSAPPPPPPPPPEPPAPGAQPDPNSPNAGGAAPDAQTPEAPPAPPAPKPLTWPAWYPGIDAALVGLVLVFAFAAASFVARNSDVWLHLAAGKRLFAGQYVPGSDPFSYSAADRAWVNHSWLLDAVAYLLYGGKGFVLVVAKALVVALAFGVLIAIRRPRFPLWPWAAVACVAVLAAAPQFTLRPLVVSILFLSVTMYLLFRLPHKPNSWRFPVAIGATFWLWANCDQWFFVGPLALALILLGDFIQTKLLNTPDEPPAEGAEEPLGRFPDTNTLAKALGVGVLACVLNPHHVRVWELPAELIKPGVADVDPRLRPLTFAPTDSLYMNHPGLGDNLNGLAYAVLFVAGAVALGFGPGRVRVAHIALFVGFAALSLVSMYAIPLFAVVTVPLIAAQFNALSAGPRAELKSWGDPRSRLLLVGSSAGRIGSVLGVCLLCVIAYPGWAHPEAGNAAYARRVAWGVEPDPALERAAEQFRGWRESGKLPPDARGFVTNIELANYLAWFAPQEKVFVNGRYNHHRRELPDYVAVRKGLGLIETKDEQAKRTDATEVLRRVNAEYVAIHAAPADGVAPWYRTSDAVTMLYRDPNEWSPWYLDGRTTVFGWRPAGDRDRPAFAALRVDPVVLAFGPNAARVPEPDLKQPLAPLGWEEPFVRPPRPAPAGATETIGWMRFKLGPALRQERRQLLRYRVLAALFFDAAGGAGAAHGFAVQTAGLLGALRFPPSEATDPGPTGLAADAAALRATPLLALRAARDAIARDPDHPDGYYALARALSDPDLPLTVSERALGRVTALRQCLGRMPKPDRYKRGQFLASASEVAVLLVGEYLGEPVLGPRDPRTGQQTVKGYVGMPIDVAPLNVILGQTVFDNPRAPQAPLERRPFARVQNEGYPSNLRPLTGTTPHFLPLDVARETLVLALEYLPLDTAGDPSDDAKRRVDMLEAARKEVEGTLIRANELYGQVKARGAELPVLVEAARGSSLPGEALQLLKDADLKKEYKEQLAHAAILLVSLDLALGRIEDANDSLGELAKPESLAALDQLKLTPVVQDLKYQTAFHAGEYKTAGEVLEGGSGRRVGLEPLLADLARNKITPHDLLFAAFADWPPLTLNRLWPSVAFQMAAQERAGRALQARAAIAGKLEFDARYFYHRGVLALLEGDTRAAKQWFQQSARKPPDGWGLPALVHADAQRYLRLIEIAERRAAAP
ncbi:MAG: hypothetical protein J0I06_18855 [Planctomycetes bacterium]|nr:hypothetical protein [Planctomycetota bacterium]